MLINDFDIADAGGRQWNVTFGSHSISNESFWESNSNTPVFLPNTVGFKQITITIMLNGSCREEILASRSTILSKLLAPCTLTLDNYDHKFFGIMKKFDGPDEKSKNRFHLLKFEFICYEFGNLIEISTNGKTEIEIVNPGNLITPVIMKIDSSISMDELVIKGVSRNTTILNGPLDTNRTESDAKTSIFTDSEEALLTDDGYIIYLSDINWINDLPMELNKLVSGKEIVVDGITGVIEDSDGGIPDISFWELPTLMPGSNIIAISNQKANITFQFFPRYM